MLAVSVIACDEKPEEEIQDGMPVRSASATADSPVETAPLPTATSTTFGSPTPSPIPAEVLLAEAQAIPTPAGATSGGGYEGAIYDDFSGVAAFSFHSTLRSDQVTNFYEEHLTAAGWVAEGKPSYWAFVERDPCIVPIQVVNWSFIRGDIRILVGAQLNPGHMSVNEIPWVLYVQPIWFPVFDTTGMTPLDGADDPTAIGTETAAC
jgi:hypothetical protein